MPALGNALGLPFQRRGASFVGALDDYTTSLSGAWSVVRRLLSSYSGSLVRIRRSSDNAETDVGYTSDGLLDQAAITSFVGSNSAYVTTIYDQVGSNAFTNASASTQPRFVNAGTIDTMNGDPAIYISGGATLNASAFSGTAGTLYSVQKNDADPGAGGDAIVANVGSSGQRDHMPFSDGVVYYGAMSTTRKTCGNPTPSLANPFLMTCVSAPASWILRLNSAAFYSTGSNTVGFGTPGLGATASLGHCAEMAFYNVAHNSSDWANIEPIFQP